MSESKPIAHLVWLQGMRAPDDVEDYFEVARPGDKCVDGSDSFPVFGADAFAAKDAQIGELRSKLFPYADATEISGISWDGKYLIGDKKSISYFHEMKNRGEQIDVYKRAYDQNIAAKDAEIAKLRETLLEVVSAVRDHIPPDGIDCKSFTSRVIGAVDNPTINPIIKAAERINGNA